MKKRLTVLPAAFLLLALTACSSAAIEDSNGPDDTAPAVITDGNIFQPDLSSSGLNISTGAHLPPAPPGGIFLQKFPHSLHVSVQKSAAFPLWVGGVFLMAKRKGFMMYFEWVDTLAELDPADFKALVLDMRRYSETGQAPVYGDTARRMAWTMMSSRLDADAERYARTVEKSREAAGKRWGQEHGSGTDKLPQGAGWQNTGLRL